MTSKEALNILYQVGIKDVYLPNKNETLKYAKDIIESELDILETIKEKLVSSKQCSLGDKCLETITLLLTSDNDDFYKIKWWLENGKL